MRRILLLIPAEIWSSIPAFLTSGFYKSITQTDKAIFSAFHDVSHYDDFTKPLYGQLVDYRPTREVALVTQLPYFERRRMKVRADTGIIGCSAEDLAPFVTSMIVRGPFKEAQAVFSKLASELPRHCRRISLHTVEFVIGEGYELNNPVLLLGEWHSQHDRNMNRNVDDLLIYDTEWWSQPRNPQTFSTHFSSKIEEECWALYKAFDNTSVKESARLAPIYPEPGLHDVADRIRARRGPLGLIPLDGGLLNCPEIAVRPLSSFIVASVSLTPNMMI